MPDPAAASVAEDHPTAAKPVDRPKRPSKAVAVTARKSRKKSAKEGGTRARARASANRAKITVSAAEIPRRTLEQSLRVAQALRKTLAGGPAKWGAIASAMKLSASPQNKYYLWSAVAYNLVKKEGDSYELSELGRKALAPTAPNEDREALVQAAMTPVVLSRFFADYNGHPYPAEEHIGNILEQTYGVPQERVAEAQVILKENGLFAGLLHPQDEGGLLVRLDPKLTGLREIPEGTPGTTTTLDAPQSSASFSKTCFVITPIGEDGSPQRRHADMLLKNLITPVCAELQMVPVRADQIDRAGLITQQVFEQLAKARVCVADLSFSNPNAFYELGVRHMCKLPTVQIIRKGDPIPFDVSQGRTIKVDMTDVYSVMDSIESAKRELKEHLKQALSSDYKGEDNPVNVYLPNVEVKLPK